MSPAPRTASATHHFGIAPTTTRGKSGAKLVEAIPKWELGGPR